MLTGAHWVYCPMSNWKAYEELTTRIYRSLAPHAKIVHDDHIDGVDSGIKRQIDTSIRTNLAGHDLLIVVQAKDLSSPADVNVVGEFATVVRDVRASKGVLICSSGFTPAAKTLARTLNIDLCTAHDANSDVWPFSISIPLLWVEYSCEFKLSMELKADETNNTPLRYSKDIDRWRFSRDRGLTLLTPFKEFARLLNAGKISRQLGLKHSYVWDTQNVRFGFEPDYWCPVAEFKLTYSLIRKAWLGTFTLTEIVGLMNESNNTLNANISISKKEFPLARDPAWPEVLDPDKLERESPNLIVVTLPEVEIERSLSEVEPPEFG